MFLKPLKIFLIFLIAIAAIIFVAVLTMDRPEKEPEDPKLIEKTFEYTGERKGIQVYDKDGNLVLDYSIEDFNRWSKENWHIFDGPPQVGGRNVQPESFDWFDKTASISPDFEKLAFSVHDYAVASYASFVGIIDLKTKELNLIKDPAPGSIADLIWSPCSSFVSYILGTGRAQGDYLAVDNTETLKREFILSENNLLEALEEDLTPFMPEFRELNWIEGGERLEFTTNTLAKGSIIWSIKNNGSDLQKKEIIGENKELPKIAIIIDDLGYNPQLDKELFEINFPLTLAILPFREHTKEAVNFFKNRDNFELILHLPLEPVDEVHIENKMALVNMTEQEIVSFLKESLEEMEGQVRGVNNHKGSRFTSNEDKMRQLFEELKNRNLFFIDSYTIAGSLGYSLAKEMGILAAKRDIFLDYVDDKEAIRQELKNLEKIARQNGSAIGIGHHKKNTIEVLKEELFNMEERGIELVVISELLE